MTSSYARPNPHSSDLCWGGGGCGGCGGCGGGSGGCCDGVGGGGGVVLLLLLLLAAAAMLPYTSRRFRCNSTPNSTHFQHTQAFFGQLKKAKGRRTAAKLRKFIE